MMSEVVGVVEHKGETEEYYEYYTAQHFDDDTAGSIHGALLIKNFICAGAS